MDPSRKPETRWTMLPALCAAVVAGGCSVNHSTPLTAWGKNEVTMLQYRTDGAECALLAVTFEDGSNAANSAGGINGQNAVLPEQRPSGQSIATGADPRGGSTVAGANPISSSSTYSQQASADMANRAALQQRTQEMAEQRARNDALKSCLVKRGYTEFTLTDEQRSSLAKLPQGSDARREYLYRLGTDPAVLSRQAVPRKAAPAAPPPGS